LRNEQEFDGIGSYQTESMNTKDNEFGGDYGFTTGFVGTGCHQTELLKCKKNAYYSSRYHTDIRKIRIDILG